MSTADARFWTTDNEYHELAEQFETSITIDSPNVVSFGCYCDHCFYRASDITYYEEPQGVV